MRHIAVGSAFVALAIIAAGCSDSHLAAMNSASAGGEVQHSNYQTGYGLSSEGPTTDLYTELKGSLKRADRPQPADPVQQPTSVAANGQQVAASSPNPGPAVAQPAEPPRQTPTTSVYGLSSDGPTTDVYSALFGSH